LFIERELQGVKLKSHCYYNFHKKWFKYHIDKLQNCKANLRVRARFESRNCGYFLWSLQWKAVPSFSCLF